MNSGIYLITNKFNDKVYVGQAVHFQKRIKKKYNQYLARAFKKYGKENFYFHILEEVEINKKLLNMREQWWMDFFQSYDPEKGYNICSVAGSTLGFHHTEKTKETIRQIHLGKTLSEEHKQKLKETHLADKNHFFGKHHTDESKMKISQHHKENKTSVGENNVMFGKHHTIETCEKLSKIQKERNWRGEDSPVSKLTWEIVNSIRNDYKTGLLSYKDINIKYNITHCGYIIKNKIWIDETYIYIKNVEAENKKRKEKLTQTHVGENSKCAKYTWVIINAIRYDYKNTSLNMKDLANKYDISRRYIRSICENEKWPDKNYLSGLSPDQKIMKIKGRSKNKKNLLKNGKEKTELLTVKDIDKP